MSVHKKPVRKSFGECAAMNADFILMESQFFHIIRMFSLRCCCCSHRVSHARAVYKLGLFAEQYQFLLLMLVLLIRYSDNRKNQLTWKVPSGVNASGKKPHSQNEKSSTDLSNQIHHLYAVLREFNFQYFCTHCLLCGFYRLPVFSSRFFFFVVKIECDQICLGKVWKTSV